MKNYGISFAIWQYATNTRIENSCKYQNRNFTVLFFQRIDVTVRLF